MHNSFNVRQFLFLTGGITERSTQTTSGYNLVHKFIQASSSARESLRVAYPDYGKHAMDDMLLDAPKYAIKSRPIDSMLREVPLPSPKIAVPSSSKKAVSDAFKEHHYYPETRSGKGLKYPQSDYEKTFSVCYRVAINEIHKQEEVTKKKRESKDTKGRVKKTAAKTSTNRPRAKRKRSNTPISDQFSSQG